MRSVTTLWEYLRANRREALVACAALFASAALSVLLPLSIGAFYSVVLGAGGGKDRLLKALGLSVGSTAGFFALFALLVTGQVLFTWLGQILSARITEGFAKELQSRLFARQLHASVPTHQAKPVGKYLLRYSGDLRGARDLVRKGVLAAIGDAFLLLIAFSAMLWIDARLAFVVIAFFGAVAVLVYAMGRPMAVINEERRDQRSRMLAFVATRFNAFRTVKSFNRETPETVAFDRLGQKVGAASMRYERWNAVLQALIPGAFFLSMATVLVLVAGDTRTGHNVHIADVLGFILLMLYTRSPMRRLLRVNAVWRSGLSSLRKLNAILLRPVEEREGPELPKPLKGDVVISDVVFAFGDGAPVIAGLSARFPAHALTHIKGESGAGRSTLLALIQKMWLPQQGTITFDGLDIAAYSAFAVRRETTIVSDDAPLLGSTVLKAITYSSSDKNQERAALIIERLGIVLHGTTSDTLAMGLDEAAANLSRGQRRMLQFARALLTRKKVLLLDEPFKDLGSADLERVVGLLNDLRASHTIILACAHPPAGLVVDHTVQLPSP